MTNNSEISDGPAVPRPGEVNRRLLAARETEGLDQVRWREKLAEAGYRFASGSVSEWERWAEVKKRKQRRKPGVSNPTTITFPPVTYLSAVSKVFGYRLDWLIFGVEPEKVPDPEAAGDGSSAAGDRAFQNRLHGDLVSLAPRVRWANLPRLRASTLALLDEARRAFPGELEAHERGFSADTALRRLVAYLDALVPVDDSYFTAVGALRPRELEQVMLHARGLAYLLFRPFREADLTFLWSSYATRVGPEWDSIYGSPEHPPAPGRRGPRGRQPAKGISEKPEVAAAPGAVAPAHDRAPATEPKEDPDYMSITLRDGEVIVVHRDPRLEAELEAQLEALARERVVITFTTRDGRDRDLSPSDVVYLDVSGGVGRAGKAKKLPEDPPSRQRGKGPKNTRGK